MDRDHNITFALDEKGSFEKTGNNSLGLVKMIAGVMYDDQGKAGAAGREKRRLDNFFRKQYKISLRKEQSIKLDGKDRYPQHMHSNNGNIRYVKKVKSQIIKELPSFFRQANGKYYIFCIIKSKLGLESIFHKDVSELEQENFGSNLYYHMAQRIVTRSIFHNPYLKPDRISSLTMEPATRAFVTKKNEMIEKTDELQVMGYRSNNNVFYTMTGDIYRMILLNEMSESGQDHIKINHIAMMQLKRSNTDHSIDMSKNELVDAAYFFLSDILCDGLSNAIPNKTINSKSLYSIRKYINELGENIHPLVYAYDIVDEYYSRARKKYERQDYFGAVEELYKIEGYKKSDCYNYYCETCIPRLLEQMESDITPNILADVVRRFRSETRKTEISLELLVFAMKIMDQWVCTMEEQLIEEGDGRILYDFYNASFNLCNHSNRPEEGKIFKEKRDNYAKYCDLETMIEGKNSDCVAMNDRLDHKGAYEAAKTNVDLYKQIHEIRGKFTKDVSFDRILAKTLSQFGQACGFFYGTTKDKSLIDNGENAFMEALSLLEKNCADYYITESYLLHLYIISSEKEKYEKQMELYLEGIKDKKEQLEFLLRQKNNMKHINWNYAVYVFLKGLYVFHSDEGTNYLKRFENGLIRLSDETKGGTFEHPWEFSICYIMRLLYSSQMKVTNNQNKLLSRINLYTKRKKGLLRGISLYGMALYHKEAQNDEDYSKCLKMAFESIYQLKEGEKNLTVDQIRNRLDKDLCYMFS